MSNKRLYINRPDAPIEQLYQEYLNKNYISFLKDSNNKKLVNRLSIDKYKEVIQDFYDNTINRVLMFIHNQYDEQYHYDGLYNEMTTYDIPFHQEHSKYQEKYLNEMYRTFLIDFTIDTELIQCDDEYKRKSNIMTTGQKSLGYRIHPRLYSSLYQWDEYRITVPEKLKDNFESNSWNYKPELNESSKRIKEMMQGWKIDIDSVPEEYSVALKKYLQEKSNNLFTQDEHGQRIYHPEVFLQKELRKYLYYDDPSEKYKLVEIENAQHFFLAMDILKDLELTNSQVNILHDLGASLNSQKDTEREKVVNKIDRYLIFEDGEYPENYFKKFLESYYPEQSRMRENEELIQLFNSDDKQLLIFILIARAGLIYDVLSSKTDYESSKEFKTFFNKYLNFELNGFGNHTISKMLKKYFKKVYHHIYNLKKRDYKRLSQILRTYETDLMIREVSMSLLDDGIKFINIHDGIIVPEDKVNEVDMNILLTSQDMFNFMIPTRVESL